MELEYSDKNNRRSKLYIAVGVIIALMVAAAVYVALQASGLTDPDRAAKTRDVVVAAREIASRKPIEEGDLVMRSVPVDPTNVTAFTRIDEVLGRVSTVAVAEGQLMTRNMLASTTEGQTFSILEPGQEYDPSGPDLRAVSVSVPDDRAVAGTLLAGQRVDLIVTMAINPAIGQPAEEAAPDEPAAGTAADFVSGPSTKVTLQQLSILARNGPIYILRTDLATAEKIAELTAAGGQFTMVLRADQDDRFAETDGSTIDTLIDEFQFRIPQPPALEERQAGS